MEVTPLDGKDVVDVVLEEELKNPVSDPDVDDGAVSVDPLTPEDVPDPSPSDALEDTEEETEKGTEEETEEESQEVDEDPEAFEAEEEIESPFSSSAPFVLEDPLPVYLVDAPEEETEIEAYSISGSPYPGTISSTYLDYFEGIADKLSYREHYVAFRSSQYEYLMAWGEGLSYDGYQFKGSALSYCRIYTGSGSSNMSVTFGSDTVYLTPGTGFVYSDLDRFASLTEGGTRLEFTTLLFAVGFAVVYGVCHDLFDYVMQHIYRKSRNRGRR